MKATNTLKSLNVSLETLYKAEDKQVVVSISGEPYEFIVSLKSGFADDMIDCKISSWGCNFWFRTPKGMNFEKYKTLGTLQRGIIHAVYKNYDTTGDITFKISDEVYRI